MQIQNSTSASSSYPRPDPSISGHGPDSRANGGAAPSDPVSKTAHAPSGRHEDGSAHETASYGSHVMQRFVEEDLRIRDEVLAGRSRPDASESGHVVTDEESSAPASFGHVVSAYTPPPKAVSDPTSYLPYTAAEVNLDPPDTFGDGMTLGWTGVGAGTAVLGVGMANGAPPQTWPALFFGGAAAAVGPQVAADDAVGIEVGGMEPDPTHPLYPAYFGDEEPDPQPVAPERTGYVTREPETESSAVEEGPQTQEVQTGDTLSGIARQNGVSVHRAIALRGS